MVSAALVLLAIGIFWSRNVFFTSPAVAEEKEVYTAQKELKYTFDPSNKYAIDLTKELENAFPIHERCLQPNIACTREWELVIKAQQKTIVRNANFESYDIPADTIQFIEPFPKELGPNSPAKFIKAYQWLLGKRKIFLDLNGNPQTPTGVWKHLTGMATAMLGNLKGRDLCSDPAATAQVANELRQRFIEKGESYFTATPFDGSQYVVQPGTVGYECYNKNREEAKRANVLIPAPKTQYDIQSQGVRVEGTIEAK